MNRVDSDAGRQLSRAPWTAMGVVSIGGSVGALARYGLAMAWPQRPGAFPWATFTTNVTGCLFIGVVTVLVAVLWAENQLLRPFLGTGILGGYTTFSTYTVDVHQLLVSGAAGTAVLYLAGTLIAALIAVYAGLAAARLATRRTEIRSAERGRRTPDEGCR